MLHNFPYLQDQKFLKNFDKIKLKEQYVKITVLTFKEKPIQQIQGRITGGSLNLDGSSSMRRTANISLITNDLDNDLTKIKNLLSINKKVEILIGFLNTTEEYQEYPIIWFPVGIFVIISPNITYDINGVNISLTLHDKMAFLNGECGGILPAPVIFHEKEEEQGNITKPTIYQIIQELVNHFGGQDLTKIIISDIDNKIPMVMKWCGSQPLYHKTAYNGKYNLLTTRYEDQLAISESEYENNSNIEEQEITFVSNVIFRGNYSSSSYSIKNLNILKENIKSIIITPTTPIHFKMINNQQEVKTLKLYFNNNLNTEILKHFTFSEELIEQQEVIKTVNSIILDQYDQSFNIIPNKIKSIVITLTSDQAREQIYNIPFEIKIIYIKSDEQLSNIFPKIVTSFYKEQTQQFIFSLQGFHLNPEKKYKLTFTMITPSSCSGIAFYHDIVDQNNMICYYPASYYDQVQFFIEDLNNLTPQSTIHYINNIQNVENIIVKCYLFSSSAYTQCKLNIVQQSSNETLLSHTYYLNNQNQLNQNITTYSYGEDVGYILTDFTYPGELIGNAGDTVVTILDNIKNTLGNYEYFYDINGNFRFQQIKNYLNTSQSTNLLNESNGVNDYLVNYYNSKSVYTFDTANIIQSYTNTPQYQQIKNDFLIWGKRTTIDGKEIPIRYHLAIDEKPLLNTYSDIQGYTDPNDNLYKLKYVNGGNLKTSKDFRTELYLQGIYAEGNGGIEKNYYYAELKSEWPKLYDLKNEEFYLDVINNPDTIDYFLDFIDAPAALNEFSINNIGRRTQVLVDDTVNCIFKPEHTNLVIIEKGLDNTEYQIEECEKRNLNYVLVDSAIYNNLVTGGILKSAYDQIKKELYQYTNYNEQISLVSLPIYYLQPNTRISVYDINSGISGDYIIKSISLPFDINNAMTVSCTKALERI